MDRRTDRQTEKERNRNRGGNAEREKPKARRHPHTLRQAASGQTGDGRPILTHRQRRSEQSIQNSEGESETCTGSSHTHARGKATRGGWMETQPRQERQEARQEEKRQKTIKRKRRGGEKLKARESENKREEKQSAQEREDNKTTGKGDGGREKTNRGR